jgi:hypothetical protein
MERGDAKKAYLMDYVSGLLEGIADKEIPKERMIPILKAEIHRIQYDGDLNDLVIEGAIDAIIAERNKNEQHKR